MAAKKKSSPGTPEANEARYFLQRARTRSTPSDYWLQDKLPLDILQMYEVHEWKHAVAILKEDFPEQLEDMIDVLRGFRIEHSHIAEGGGGKSKVAASLDSAFEARGWHKKRWSTAIVLDDQQRHSPTHEVDCVKGRVALEIEWSNKDPFYDRDLNNYRLLFDLRAISVGVIITKSNELAALFEELGTWGKYGTTTTWMSKLLPRIEGGGGGGCPVLVFGLRRQLYRAPAKVVKGAKL